MSKTRLIESVRTLDLPSAKKLLDTNPSLLLVTDRQFRNLLHLACSAPYGRLNVSESSAARMVDFLLDLGMDIESAALDGSCGGMPPICFAVARGRNLTVVKLLLKRGAKATGLFAAGWYEDLPMLNLLIRGGAVIDEVVGLTPFLACWCWKKFDAAKLLARRGADVNYQEPGTGKAALHFGIEKRFDPALLQWLVKHGASPDLKDHEGVSAKLKAARKRDKRFLAALG